MTIVVEGRHDFVVCCNLFITLHRLALMSYEDSSELFSITVNYTSRWSRHGQH
jgi:hypothetical protein